MDGAIEGQILQAEERLRTAMLKADVTALEGLLAPELIFTNHLGRLVGKEDDLAAYRSGLLKVEELTPSERQIRLHGEVAVVSVRMRLSGTYDGGPANGDLRFTRVWALAAPERSSWRVVAAHAALVV
jgi:ketosteroid isomerase-like protein